MSTKTATRRTRVLVNIGAAVWPVITFALLAMVSVDTLNDVGDGIHCTFEGLFYDCTGVAEYLDARRYFVNAVVIGTVHLAAGSLWLLWRGGREVPPTTAASS